MMPAYRGMMQVVRWLIGRAFSSEVIQTGRITGQDVVQWLWQQTQELVNATWFHPSVRVRKSSGGNVGLPGEDAAVANERDGVFRVDYGLTALGLNRGAACGIAAALGQAQRFQDVALAELRARRTGNEVLAAFWRSRARCGPVNRTVGPAGRRAGQWGVTYPFCPAPGFQSN
jgi:hypothetical protein